MKIPFFVKEFIAIISGDDNKATAFKAWRQSESALKVRIAYMEGETLAKEDAVEAAENAAKKALVNNGQLVEDKNLYTIELVKADTKLKEAKQDLKKHLETLEFFKAKLQELQAEVDEA